MLTFEQCDELVKKLVPELLANTGLTLSQTWPSGRAIGVVDARDAYEFRIGVITPWARVIRRIEVPAIATTDEPALMREVTGLVLEARRSLAAEMRGYAKRVEPE